MIPQILKLNRATKASDTALGSALAAQTKPKPVQRSKPLYQALGAVEGVLSLDKNSPCIETESGAALIEGLRDQKLLLWLLGNAEQWQSKAVKWLVYPNLGRYTLVAAATEQIALAPQEFLIVGHIQPPKPGHSARLIRVNRNDRKDRAYNLVLINGDFDGVTDGSLIKVVARFDRGRLYADSVAAVEVMPVVTVQ